MEHLWNGLEDHPSQHENSHKLCDKTGHSLWIWWKSMDSETTTWSKFPNEGKAIVEQILPLEEINPNEQKCENYSLGSEKES